MNEKTSLYRHYDGDGTLLYIGISLSPIARLQSHRRASRWFERIARIEVEWFDTRAAAMKAERTAIQSEKPRFNKDHSKSHVRVFMSPERRERLEKLSELLAVEVDVVGPEKAAEILTRFLGAITDTYGKEGADRVAMAAEALNKVGPKKEPVSIQSYGNFKAERWHGVLDDLIEKMEAE